MPEKIVIAEPIPPEIPPKNPDMNEAKEAIPGSGLYNMIQQYTKPAEPAVPPVTPPAEPSTPPEPPKPPEPPAPTDVEFDKLEKPDLIQHINKFKTSLSESDTKIKDYETQLSTIKSELDTLKSSKLTDEDAQEFMDGLRKDFSATYTKFKDKYKLPDLSLVSAQSNGDVKSRLKQYTDSIKPQIEKEFNLEEGTFKFDYDEAIDNPNSASGRFLELRNTKENELRNEVTNLQAKQSQLANSIKEQQVADIKWIADTYYDGKMEEAQKIVAEMEQAALEVSSGKASLDKHPYSYRTIMLGYRHEALTQIAVEKAITDLKAQYAALGMNLPASKEMPTDPTKLKNEGDNKGFRIEHSEYSPMKQSIERMVNK